MNESRCFPGNIPSTLVSHGCCNKLPQTRWIETMGIYILMVQKDRKRQGVHKALLPLEAPEENPFFTSSSFWYLLVLLDLWLHHSDFCLSGHIASASSPCQNGTLASLLERHWSLDLVPTWVSHDKLLSKSLT